jgi:predicted transcriptional regulator
MAVERILKKVLPDETGAARLQQIGVFTLIYMLQGDKEPITARRLAMMTGQSEGQIGVLLQKLLDVRLVERKQILNKQGRGLAWQLAIVDSAQTRRLVKAIEKGARKKRNEA